MNSLIFRLGAGCRSASRWLGNTHLPTAGLAVFAALLFLAHCSSFPKKGDVPVTMSQVREGTVVPQRAPEPEPAMAKRAAPAMDAGEMEVAVQGGLNYRSSPGLQGRILGSIPYRSRIAVLERETNEPSRRNVKGRWYKINYNGRTGYVNSKYLREAGESRSINATPRKRRAKRNKKTATPPALTNP